MTAKAAKLLEQLRRSKANCGRRDLELLYLGYGFRIRIGEKHDMAIHEKYKHLRGTLPNHTSFAIGYVTCAINLIDEVLRLEQQGG
jgi:hypothetical protein